MAAKSRSMFGRFISGAIKFAALAAICIAGAALFGPMSSVVALKGFGALFSASSWSLGAAASAGDIICLGPTLAAAFKGTAMGFGVGKVIAGAAAVGGVGSAVFGGSKDSAPSPQYADLQQVGGPVGRSQGYERAHSQYMAPAQNTPGMEAGQYRGRV